MIEVGQIITIYNYLNSWRSSLGECPADLTYPVTGLVTKVSTEGLSLLVNNIEYGFCDYYIAEDKYHIVTDREQKLIIPTSYAVNSDFLEVFDRGFVGNISYDTPHGNTYRNIESEYPYYYESHSAKIAIKDNCGLIKKDGNWAKLIDRPSFHIGDWVTVIKPHEDTESSLLNFRNYQEAIGYVFQLTDYIIACMENDNDFVTPGNKYGKNYDKHCIRKLTDKELYGDSNTSITNTSRSAVVAKTSIDKLIVYKSKDFTPVTELQQQLIKLVLFNPNEIRKYLKTVENPQYCVNFINSLLPTRVGLEFDVVYNKSNIQDHIYSLEPKGIRVSQYSSSLNINNELRISFKRKFKFLIHFQNFLNTCIKDELMFPATDGGLHIHIDCSGHFQVTKSKIIRNRSREDIVSSCNIHRRFNQVKKYKNYLYKVFDVKSDEKRGDSWLGNGRTHISKFRSYPTVEYRMANMTLNYSQIMKYIIICKLITDTVRIKNHKFNKKLADNILAMDY